MDERYDDNTVIDLNPELHHLSGLTSLHSTQSAWQLSNWRQPRLWYREEGYHYFLNSEIFCGVVPLSSYHFLLQSNTTYNCPCRPQLSHRKQISLRANQTRQSLHHRLHYIYIFSEWTSRTSTPPSCSPSRRLLSTASPESSAPRSTSGKHFDPADPLWPRGAKRIGKRLKISCLTSGKTRQEDRPAWVIVLANCKIFLIAVFSGVNLHYFWTWSV